jgi:hypothetical protein
MQHGSVTQPYEKIVTIGGGKYICEGISRFATLPTVRNSEEVEIMIAQYRYGTISQSLDKPENLQRLRATVYQVTSKPELIACAIKM